MSVLVACGPAEHRPIETTTGDRQERIIDGAPDDGDPAVVALVIGGATACTGTLISDRVVLTAAHCLGHGIPSVAFGVDVSAPLATMDPVDVRVHTGFDADSLDNDIALMLLGSPAPAQAIALPTLAQVMSDVDTGKAVRIVGFGVNSTSGSHSGRKYSGTALISWMEESSFGMRAGPSHTCSGDSGGPALLARPEGEVVAGVTSSGSSNCTEEARQVRVDRYLADFVMPYLAQTARGAAAPGGRCFHQESCAQGQCYEPAEGQSFPYCQDNCGVDSDCPLGTRCAASGVCAYSVSGPGGAGWPCETGYDCVSGLCARSAAGAARVCSVRCFPENAVPCENGLVCLQNADNEHRYACFKEPSEAEVDEPTTGHGGCSTKHPSRSDGVGVSITALFFSYLATRHWKRREARSCGGKKKQNRKKPV